MKRSVVVARAKAVIGLPTIYELGKGGFTASKPTPGSKCDCSGFVAWVLGVSRKTNNPYYKNQNGGWFETSAVFKDATNTMGMVDKVEINAVKPGDLVVWPDGGGRQGHIGIVSVVEGLPKMVIHCSTGNYRKTGDAIQETPVDIFLNNNAIFAKVGWVEDD
jgi:cell wall-associated NlpC family hydrolase